MARHALSDPAFVAERSFVPKLHSSARSPAGIQVAGRLLSMTPAVQGRQHL